MRVRDLHLTSNWFDGKNLALTSDEIEELRVFLRDHVSTFEELEVLRFLMKAPRRPWSCSELAAALGLSEELVQTALGQLATVGELIAPSSDAGSTGSYYFTPNEPNQRLLEALGRAYDEQRLTILGIMSSNALERVRSMAARRLADAFRLGRTKK